jgi:hypothetical protein
MCPLAATTALDETEQRAADSTSLQKPAARRKQGARRAVQSHGSAYAKDLAIAVAPLGAPERCNAQASAGHGPPALLSCMERSSVAVRSRTLAGSRSPIPLVWSEPGGQAPGTSRSDGIANGV